MIIDAKMIKELRNKSGVGMNECKKALERCLGHEDLAIEWLRKRGLAVSVKMTGMSPDEARYARYEKPYEDEARKRGYIHPHFEWGERFNIPGRGVLWTVNLFEPIGRDLVNEYMKHEFVLPDGMRVNLVGAEQMVAGERIRGLAFVVREVKNEVAD